MWFDESVIYQIYPLGYLGAPVKNEGVLEHRFLKLIEHIPHFKKLNINAIYFCPIWESSNHGYDTKDFKKIDCRLGTNDDFKQVCNKLHENKIKIILDGVFNHVGRDFWAFKDVQENKYNSKYKDWFYINFDGNSGYNDGFYYEGWEGHYELVKLNLDNYELKQYLFDAIKYWVEEFQIDGLRLDVAYLLNKNFLKELRTFCDSLKQDFVLIGEMIHGDYNTIVNNEMLHSATNYECFKGVYSSFNEMNMFEISYSLNREFGKEHWCLYTGKNLLNFIDNHDVSRIATLLNNKNHLKSAFGLLFTMPGVPNIYYGSEWGIEGEKTPGSDANLRPEIAFPNFNELSEFISKLCDIRINNKTLAYGDFENLLITNKQYIFKREYNGEKIFVLINAEDTEFTCENNYNISGKELITNKEISQNSSIPLPAYSIQIIQSI